MFNKLIRFFTREEILSVEFKNSSWVVTTNKQEYYSSGGEFWYCGVSGKIMFARPITRRLKGAVTLYRFRKGDS